VLTKVLEVPSPIARTFGLSIQAVGMSMAVVAILLYRRRIHARAAIIGSIAAVVGFLGSVALFGESDEPFWPTSIPTEWVKASFSIVLATTSIMMVRHLRQHQTLGLSETHDDDVPWTARFTTTFVSFAVIGGMLSALTGTGANILVFLFLVVVAGTNPKTALPTAIVVMTAVSIVGFVLFGLIDGQLDVELVGDRVTSVGGQPPDLLADRTDLLGLWLAAVPVVVWGAPLGSLVVSRVRESWLVTFVAILAAAEVVTTFWLVTELQTDALLFTYLVLGLIVVPTSFVLLRRYRAQLFGMP
jgi:uncharacterized membrane protein YfcA